MEQNISSPADDGSIMALKNGPVILWILELSWDRSDSPNSNGLQYIAIISSYQSSFPVKIGHLRGTSPIKMPKWTPRSKWQFWTVLCLRNRPPWFLVDFLGKKSIYQVPRSACFSFIPWRSMGPTGQPRSVCPFFESPAGSFLHRIPATSITLMMVPRHPKANIA